MTEMVPDDETVRDWSEMVTTQVFSQLVGKTPEDLLRGIGEKWVGGCPGTTHGDIINGNANGYPVSMLLLRCPQLPSTGKPETTLFRAIRGTKTPYLIQYAFRQQVTAVLISKAAAYLVTVNVCDAGAVEHACPDLAAEGFKKQ